MSLSGLSFFAMPMTGAATAFAQGRGQGLTAFSSTFKQQRPSAVINRSLHMFPSLFHHQTTFGKKVQRKPDVRFGIVMKMSVKRCT